MGLTVNTSRIDVARGTESRIIDGITEICVRGPAVIMVMKAPDNIDLYKALITGEVKLGLGCT